MEGFIRITEVYENQYETNYLGRRFGWDALHMVEPKVYTRRILVRESDIYRVTDDVPREHKKNEVKSCIEIKNKNQSYYCKETIEEISSMLDALSMCGGGVQHVI